MSRHCFAPGKSLTRYLNIFQKHNTNGEKSPRLREQEWGHLRTLEDCIEIEKLRDDYGTFYFRIPDGEGAADVYDRVSDF